MKWFRKLVAQKLAIILEDFGVDKSSDVLDSAQAGKIFDDLYIDAIVNPDALDIVFRFFTAKTYSTFSNCA